MDSLEFIISPHQHSIVHGKSCLYDLLETVHEINTILEDGDVVGLLESVNLRSGSIFVSLWKLHFGGQGETKRKPDTNLLRNVCRPLF